MVEIISGADKGKRGKVLQAIPATGMVVVEGINKKWKHLRRSQENPQGGRLQREIAIHACKVKKA
jgi:large subunit ribosomal protein L24